MVLKKKHMGAFFVKWPSRHFFFFFLDKCYPEIWKKWPTQTKITVFSNYYVIVSTFCSCPATFHVFLTKKDNDLTRRKRRVNINRVVFNSLYLWFLPLKNELKIFILNCKHRCEFRNLGVKQCEFQSLLTSIVLVLLKGSSNQQVVLPGASNQPTRSQFSAEVHFSSDGSYPLVR